MKIKIFFLISILLLSNCYKAQTKETSDSKQFIYNISLGGVIGAIGAIINKKHNQKFGNILFKGFYQGALGGYFTFESKRLIRVAEKNNDWKILWCSKFVNAAGTSIKENAAANKDFWEKWHINFGFSRLEFQTKNNFKINYKIMPVALIYTINIASQSKFEIEKTLQSGELIFSSNNNKFFKTNTEGSNFPGAIILQEPYKNDFQLLSHEIIHQYQSNDFSQIEVFIDKPLDNINQKNKFANKITKHIQLDFRYLPQIILYNFENKKAYFYYDNPFEKEAGFYSGTFNPYLLNTKD